MVIKSIILTIILLTSVTAADLGEGWNDGEIVNGSIEEEFNQTNTSKDQETQNTTEEKSNTNPNLRTTTEEKKETKQDYEEKPIFEDTKEKAYTQNHYYIISLGVVVVLILILLVFLLIKKPKEHWKKNKNLVVAPQKNYSNKKP